MRVLTDPVWGSRASPSQWAGPKRFQPVPIPIRALPPLDAVVISHDHYDHLDYTTIRALAQRDVPFITSLGVGAHLEAWGVPAHRIIELDWWESYALPKVGLTVTAAPSQHFSGRGLRSRNSTLWSSMVIRSRRHAVFFSGDTGLTTEYAEILRRLGPFDLVMPRLGEPVEPAHVEQVSPWWRAAARRPQREIAVELRETSQHPSEGTAPKSLPWPID